MGGRGGRPCILEALADRWPADMCNGLPVSRAPLWADATATVRESLLRGRRPHGLDSAKMAKMRVEPHSATSS
jgi:hypothetical protein